MSGAPGPIGLTVEAETDALLSVLERDELADGVVRASAMLAAAVSYLARVTGHAAVAAQLRADADTVERFAPPPDAVPPAPAQAATVH